MSMDVEAAMRAALDGRFFSLNHDTGKVIERPVKSNYLPGYCGGTKQWKKDGNTSNWTASEDDELLSARHEYLTWDKVSDRLGKGVHFVRRRYIEVCKQRGIRPLSALPAFAVHPGRMPKPKLIGETVSPPPKREGYRGSLPTMREIMAAVCYVSQIPEKVIISPRRQVDIAAARAVFCWLSVHYAGTSLYQTGKIAGGRDHSTVRHNIVKVDNQFQDYSEAIAKVLDVLGIDPVRGKVSSTVGQIAA